VDAGGGHSAPASQLTATQLTTTSDDKELWKMTMGTIWVLSQIWMIYVIHYLQKNLDPLQKPLDMCLEHRHSMLKMSLKSVYRTF